MLPRSTTGISGPNYLKLVANYSNNNNQTVIFPLLSSYIHPNQNNPNQIPKI
ncbi:hypothetical protein Hanom_Chr07g00647011 [Helianthus anomalus]